MEELKIDPEFQDKIPPLTEEEFSLLEENILSDGAVFSPIIVWDGVILDGHNRYEIIQKHPELTYAVRKMRFANRYEALSWICRNQLGRRNLTPQQKKYLIGQRYEAEKMAHGGDRKSSRRSTDKICPLKSSHQTRASIAQDAKVSEGFVENAATYARGVDAAEEALPGIKQEILTGVIKPTASAVAAVAKAEPEERQELAADLRKQDDNRGGNRKKATPETQYHTPKSSSRKADLAKIAEISAEMERTKAPATEDSMLRTLEGEVASFTGLCDHFFREYPRLLSDDGYKQKVIRILQELKNYISKIEGGSTNEHE